MTHHQEKRQLTQTKSTMTQKEQFMEFYIAIINMVQDVKKNILAMNKNIENTGSKIDIVNRTQMEILEVKK